MDEPDTEDLRDLTVASQLERYPPFRYLGVKVLEIGHNWGVMRMAMPLNRDTKNPGGSMFGGSIAAFADPVPALACVYRYPDYDVWTRELNLDFRKPGLTDLELRFVFPEQTAALIEQDLAQAGRSTPWFEYAIYDSQGEVTTRVRNRVAIRPKSPRSGSPAEIRAHNAD
ncbi:MAG: PaaI family thioesterase [Candidatus Thiodiazotropha sp.]